MEPGQTENTPAVLAEILADPKAENLDRAMEIVRKRPGSLKDADLLALVRYLRAERARRVSLR